MVLAITILVCASISLLFSIVAAKIHHRWAFAVVIVAVSVHLSLSILQLRRTIQKEADMRNRLELANEALSEQKIK
jgi:hypothetical protein